MLIQTNLIKILQTGSNKLKLILSLSFITVPENCLIKPEIVSHSITCSELAFQSFMHCDFRAELIIHTHIIHSSLKPHQNLCEQLVCIPLIVFCTLETRSFKSLVLAREFLYSSVKNQM